MAGAFNEMAYDRHFIAGLVSLRPFLGHVILVESGRLAAH
jgi:hypothetical protein